jgi:hypothetical protein
MSILIIIALTIFFFVVLTPTQQSEEKQREFDSDMVESSIGTLSARRRAYMEVIEDLNCLIIKK